MNVNVIYVRIEKKPDPECNWCKGTGIEKNHI